MTDSLTILKTIFNFDQFRGDQEKIVNSVIAGENALILMPTGGGKSLCYQIPALARTGTAIVISPLIALMK
ncbi:MAG: DEAD/DEAH box helicase, partial [Bacteriovorax sp.]|nr:DEAD/DEAH box helicase [Bacteriovorax sp.]